LYQPLFSNFILSLQFHYPSLSSPTPLSLGVWEREEEEERELGWHGYNSVLVGQAR